MEVNHIVVLGCSLTYCQNSPIEQGWPYLIAKELNCNVVNLGVPGVGNDTMHRKLYEYFYNDNEIVGSKPFVIIAYSQPWRHELWSKTNYTNVNFHDYTPFSYPHSETDSLSYAQHNFLENYNEVEFHRRNLLVKSSIVNLLKFHDIPYITADAMCQDFDSDAYISVKNKFNGLHSYLKNSHYIGELWNQGIGDDHLPCGHWGPRGHLNIKDYMITYMKKFYPEVSYINNTNFLSLKEYIKTDKYHQKFPNWVDFVL